MNLKFSIGEPHWSVTFFFFFFIEACLLKIWPFKEFKGTFGKKIKKIWTAQTSSKGIPMPNLNLKKIQTATKTCLNRCWPPIYPRIHCHTDVWGSPSSCAWMKQSCLNISTKNLTYSLNQVLYFCTWTIQNPTRVYIIQRYKVITSIKHTRLQAKIPENAI